MSAAGRLHRSGTKGFLDVFAVDTSIGVHRIWSAVKKSKYYSKFQVAEQGQCSHFAHVSSRSAASIRNGNANVSRGAMSSPLRIHFISLSRRGTTA